MKYIKYILSAVILGLIVWGIIASQNNGFSSSKKVQIVAGENFWGSLVSQLGGDRVSVTSIVTDPNADPHEYEVSSADARLFAKANYVILNGVGYDSWANKLLSAQPENGRKVLTVGNLVNVQNGQNPHLWYNPSYVNSAMVQMDRDLDSIDPAGKSYYDSHLATLQNSLANYQSQIQGIKQQFSGVKVAATEDIFVYLANASGLDLISPPAFMQAVAEGNDPPADSVVQFENQLNSGQVKLLVYNTQTVTPITENIKALANKDGIPIVGISETLQPVGSTFQNWMSSEMQNITSDLGHASVGN